MPGPDEPGMVGPDCTIPVMGVETPDSGSAELVVVQTDGRERQGLMQGEWSCWYIEGYEGRHLLIQASSAPSSSWNLARAALARPGLEFARPYYFGRQKTVSQLVVALLVAEACSASQSLKE